MTAAVHLNPRAPNAEEAARKDKALALWEADRSRLLLAQPFLALLTMQLDLVPVVDDRLDTACTDGERVYVHANFLLGLSEVERVFVLAHEVWHCALGHFARRVGRHAKRWNLAADHEVNTLLEEQGLSVPEDAILFPRWRGENAEAVYERLQRKDDAALPERGALADHHDVPAGLGGGARAVLDPDFSPATAGRREVWEAWPARVVAAAQQVSQRGGILPGSVERIVEAYRLPAVPWQHVLRRFVHKNRDTSRSWRRPDRRLLSQGLYLPGRGGGFLDIALAIDTSGSTTYWLPAFVSELNGIVGPYNRYRLRVLTCDTRIQGSFECSPDNPLRLDRLQLDGGGGTDFRPVFEHLAGQDPPQALLFFTDGYGPAPSAPPPWPVLWVLTAEGERPAEWGEVVRLPDGRPCMALG